MKQPEIITKAWVINTDNLEESWYCNDNVYYGTRGHAKNMAVCDNDAMLTLDNEELSLLNVRIKRHKQSDIIIYDGERIKRYQIAQLERDKKLKLLPDNKYYYVQDMRNYVGNAVLWHGLNGGGYVTDLAKAHKYTKDEVVKDFTNGRDTDIIWYADHVEKAIRQYVDAQGLKKEFCI